MTDATFAQAAAAAGLIMAICTIAKVWKKIMQHIEQDEARMKRADEEMEKAREERRGLKW